MDISTSSYGGYSPPHTPVLKRRKSEILARVSLGLDLHEPPLPTTSSPANQKMSTADILQVDANGDDTTLHLSSVPHVTTSSDMADRTTTMTASMNPSSSTSFFPVSFINEYIYIIYIRDSTNKWLRLIPSRINVTDQGRRFCRSPPCSVSRHCERSRAKGWPSCWSSSP